MSVVLNHYVWSNLSATTDIQIMQIFPMSIQCKKKKITLADIITQLIKRIF